MSDTTEFPFPFQIGCEFEGGESLLWHVEWIDGALVLSQAEDVESKTEVKVRPVLTFHSVDAFKQWRGGLELLLQSTASKAAREVMDEMEVRINNTAERLLPGGRT